MYRSPGARRKNKAPLPPPSSSSSQPVSVEQVVIQQIPPEQNSNDQISNQNLTGKRCIINKEEKETKITTSKSVEEPSSRTSPIKNIYQRFTRGFFLLAFYVIFNCS
jgi:hypothetical protein